MKKCVPYSKRIGAMLLALALVVCTLPVIGASTIAETDTTVEKFTADFSGLTSGEVSTDATNATTKYLTSKFKFYYEQEGKYFLRKNVNDYYVDVNGTPITTPQNPDIDLYYPDTGELRGKSTWIDGIGTKAASNGIATWTVTDDGMLYVAKSSAGAQYFRRYNQAVVLDANGQPAVLKNFRLKMDFKLSSSGLSHTTVAFRAKNEVATVNSSGSSEDRALVSLNPSGYFIGGPTDEYENNSYTSHFKQDTDADVNSYTFSASTVYTLDLQVLGSKITATVYNGDTQVTTFEKETQWTNEGYIVIGGSNAGGYYDNIEITRLDDNGKAVDFTAEVTPEPEPGPTVKTFKADFSALTPGAVSAQADVEYLTSKFKFYYEQEGKYFLRPNVNDYYVDVNGNPITTAQNPDIDLYYPDTREYRGTSTWIDGIGTKAASNGIATWAVTNNGMLYVANSSKGDQYFRRYNQAVVLDANGQPAVLKNFRLKMDFKLSGEGLSHTTVAFRAKNEVATVNSSGSSADRALVSLNKSGYFIGGPTDTYENNSYESHFKQDKDADVESYNFGTTTVYTLDLRVVGNNITATVYNGATKVTTFEKETQWTNEGYIVIGGSNAGGYYGNIEITRLDNNGNAIDFDRVGQAADCPWDTTVDTFSQSMSADVADLESWYDFYYSDVTGTKSENLSAHWAQNGNGILMRQNDLDTTNATDKVALMSPIDTKYSDFDAVFKLTIDEEQQGTFWVTARQQDGALVGKVVSTPGDTDYVAGQVTVGFAVGGAITISDGTADPIVIAGNNVGTPSGTYTLRVRLYGNMLEVYVNGTQRVARTLANTQSVDGYLAFGYSGAELGIGSVDITRLNEQGVPVNHDPKYVSVSSNTVDPIIVSKGESEASVRAKLDTTLTVTDTDGGSISSEVYWDFSTIDLSMNGDYKLIGYLKETNDVRAVVNVYVGAYDRSITTQYDFADSSQLDDFTSWYMPTTAGDNQSAILTEGTTDDTWYISNGQLTYKRNSMYLNANQLSEGTTLNNTLWQDDRSWSGFAANFGVAVLNTKKFENFILEVDFKQNSYWNIVGFGAQDSSDPLSVFASQYKGGYAFNIESSGDTGKARLWGYNPDEGKSEYIETVSVQYDWDASSMHHYKIIVSDGMAYMYIDDASLPVTFALPETYQAGYIYLALNANGSAYDNLRITSLDEKQINITEILTLEPAESDIDRKAGESLSVAVNGMLKVADEDGYEYELPYELVSDTYRSNLEGRHEFEAVFSPLHNMTVASDLEYKVIVNNKINGDFDPKTTVKYYFDHPNDFLDFYSQYSEPRTVSTKDHGDQTYYSGYDGDLVTIDADKRWKIVDGRATTSYTANPGNWGGMGKAIGTSTLILKDLNLMNFRLEFDFTQGTNLWYSYLIFGVQNPNKMYGTVNWNNEDSFEKWLDGSSTNTSTAYDNSLGGGIWCYLEQEGYFNIQGALDGGSNSLRDTTDLSTDFIRTYDKKVQHHMVIEVIDGLMSMQVDDSDIYYAGIALDAWGGLVGFGAHGNGSTYDNFQITALDENGQPMALADAEKGWGPQPTVDTYEGWQPAKDEWFFEWGKEYEKEIKDNTKI